MSDVSPPVYMRVSQEKQPQYVTSNLVCWLCTSEIYHMFIQDVTLCAISTQQQPCVELFFVTMTSVFVAKAIIRKKFHWSLCSSLPLVANLINAPNIHKVHKEVFEQINNTAVIYTYMVANSKHIPCLIQNIKAMYWWSELSLNVQCKRGYSQTYGLLIFDMNISTELLMK